MYQHRAMNSSYSLCLVRCFFSYLKLSMSSKVGGDSLDHGV